MSETPTVQRLTAEEFAALPDDGRRTELIRGEVVERTPATFGHGEVTLNVMYALKSYAIEHGGRAATNDPGIVLERGPDTVRAPDGAYYAADRVDAPAERGFSAAVPDLVLEVVSPDDRRGEVVAKAGAWLQAGVRVVWVVWPATRQVAVYGPDEVIDVLGVGETLTCEPLLPGFALPVADIFTA